MGRKRFINKDGIDKVIDRKNSSCTFDCLFIFAAHEIKNFQTFLQSCLMKE